MKQVLIEKYGTPWEVARCAEVPDVGAPAADDVVLKRAGATVVVDQVSLPYLAGSEIDFVDDLMGASFRIKNPQATQSCGCGTSFSV